MSGFRTVDLSIAGSYYVTENGKDDCGVFEFAMIWQKKDDRWRITRVISYGHW